nr:FtsX-like permease family protein [Bacteroidota bacterium]
MVEDFHFESMQKDISPLIMYIGRNNGNIITFRYQTENVNSVIELLESKWKEFLPNQPFEYSFLNERFNNMYYEEQQISKIMLILTALAIVIASLGLFGLSAFMAEERTKEVAIRKIIGASARTIFLLFFKGILKLTFISYFIAIPFTWYFMNDWLNNFAYKVNIHWSTFAVSGLIAFIIVTLTVFYQAYQASVRSPVESLNRE